MHENVGLAIRGDADALVCGVIEEVGASTAGFRRKRSVPVSTAAPASARIRERVAGRFINKTTATFD